MTHLLTEYESIIFAIVAAAILVTALNGTFAIAQSQQTEEKVMAVKQAQATNKQKLAQYTWQETETISIKGEVKDTKVYQVDMANG